MLSALSTSDSIALGAGIVAVIALGVAVWAVLVARGANDLSEESNDLAREALDHSARQTALAESADVDRQREKAARAAMTAELSPLFVKSNATAMYLRGTVKVVNSGDRDSGRVAVRVYMGVYQSADLMAWEDQHHDHDRVRPVQGGEFQFTDVTTGAPIQTQFLDRTLDNVSPTMPEELRIVLPFPLPPAGDAPYRLPVKIVVKAARADEAFERTDYVTVEHGPPPT